MIGREIWEEELGLELLTQPGGGAGVAAALTQHRVVGRAVAPSVTQHRMVGRAVAVAVAVTQQNHNR